MQSICSRIQESRNLSFENALQLFLIKVVECLSVDLIVEPVFYQTVIKVLKDISDRAQGKELKYYRIISFFFLL